MKNKLTKEIAVFPSMCDSAALLGIPDTFALFMDAATEHACALGYGIDVLTPRGLFWLTVRTRVRFFRRPRVLERVTLETWPERVRKLRADRDYRIARDGETLIAGKTEWAVLETDTGRLHPMTDVFASGFDYYPDAVWTEPYTRMADAPLEEFARHTVASTDIDLGGHMNNAAYIRALAGAFSCEAWQGMNVRELEIAYRASCYEGETLVWQKREDGDELALRAALPDGKTVALARLVRGQA